MFQNHFLKLGRSHTRARNIDVRAFEPLGHRTRVKLLGTS